MTKLLACARHRAYHGGGCKTIQGESAVPDTPKRGDQKDSRKGGNGKPAWRKWEMKLRDEKE